MLRKTFTDTVQKGC